MSVILVLGNRARRTRKHMMCRKHIDELREALQTLTRTELEEFALSTQSQSSSFGQMLSELAIDLSMENLGFTVEEMAEFDRVADIVESMVSHDECDEDSDERDLI